mmetsp:Transcript_5281/g.15346  ORF Transcript_5281/g.15346 Transcript_5281/m.15346 type:complete len:403 (-) Transcript_5281:137-1345(-)
MNGFILAQFIRLVLAGIFITNVHASNLRFTSYSDLVERRAEEKLIVYTPSIAKNINKQGTFDGDELIVDGDPESHILLQFNDLSDAVKAELVLFCSNDSGRGGKIYLSETPIVPGVTWDNQPSPSILTKVAELGRVMRDRTYKVDVTEAVTTRSNQQLTLVILPGSNNGAGYIKNEIKLEITTTGQPPEDSLVNPQENPPTNQPEDPPVDPPEDPPEEPPTDIVVSDKFQLMLWFDKDFKWQGTTEQYSWCATCGGGKKKNRKKSSSCKNGESIRLYECDDDNKAQWWKWKNGQIMPYTDDDLCWDRDTPEYLELKKCNGGRYQRFAGGPSPRHFNTNGNYEQYRFELYPHEQDGKSCVTQRHHPRNGEELLKLPCDRAQKHDTSYWIAASPPTLNGHSLDD